jgi:hypothetical protein
VLFLFKCGLASKAGRRHLSWNNSGGSATSIPVAIPAKPFGRVYEAIVPEI